MHRKPKGKHLNTTIGSVLVCILCTGLSSRYNGVIIFCHVFERDRDHLVGKFVCERLIVIVVRTRSGAFEYEILLSFEFLSLITFVAGDFVCAESNVLAPEPFDERGSWEKNGEEFFPCLT